MLHREGEGRCVTGGIDIEGVSPCACATEMRRGMLELEHRQRNLTMQDPILAQTRSLPHVLPEVPLGDVDISLGRTAKHKIRTVAARCFAAE